MGIKDNHGFSLFELITCTAIVLIISSLLMVQISSINTYKLNECVEKLECELFYSKKMAEGKYANSISLYKDINNRLYIKESFYTHEDSNINEYINILGDTDIVLEYSKDGVSYSKLDKNETINLSFSAISGVIQSDFKYLRISRGKKSINLSLNISTGDIEKNIATSKGDKDA